MDELQNFWSRTKPHLIWIMTGTIFILYLIAWLIYYFTPLLWLSTILSQAATAVLVSGVFASLLKSYQFSKLFKDELARFFTSPDMMKEMRRIAVFGRTGDDVIHKAMEHAVNINCPELSHKFQRSSAKLLRFKHEYFHRNFSRTITLVDYDPSDGMVKIRDDMSCGLGVTANTNYVSKHSGIVHGTGTTVTKLTVSVDGMPAMCLKDSVQSEGETMTVEFPVISGKNYRFNRVFDQYFELRKDPVIQQQFVRFSDGMTLKVINEVTDKLDFNVHFLNFEEQVQPEELWGKDEKTCQKTYTVDHLTFPYQGYIVTLNPI